MKIIHPGYEILKYDKDALKLLERIGRTCYKSEDKITDDSYEKFLKMIISRGHEAMIEHATITVKFIHNRGFSHELVRHRLASFSQSSTRYCNYSKDKFGNEITVIEPYWWDLKDIEHIKDAQKAWEDSMNQAEKNYFNILNSGLPPQAARGVLPLDLKTEIVITANFREWRNILNLRCAGGAHPDMRRVMVDLLGEFYRIYPVIFQDLYIKFN